MMIYRWLAFLFKHLRLSLGLALLILTGGWLPAAQAQGTNLPSGFSEFLVATHSINPLRWLLRRMEDCS